jgi:hydroxymethylbilane synthase
MDHLVTETLEPPRWLPAATQGTIGIQCREGDDPIIDLIEPLRNTDAVLRTRAERAVATALQGSCQVPLAVFADFDGEQFRIRGMVGMPDGSKLVRAGITGSPADVDRLASAVSDDLISQGADRIIASLA